jgi:hypothetical protein
MKLPLRPWTTFLVVSSCLSASIPASGGSSGEPTYDGPRTTQPVQVEMVTIPGPLRSFLRMAGISQEASPEEVLPLVARNVSLHGFENGGATEYLALLRRYVEFARELRQLADAQSTIRVANCDEAERLVDVLGYQFAEGCGEKSAYVVTANAERAFLTIDSGFPLTGLEDALRKHTDFVYQFPATEVPVLFREQDWVGATAWRQKGGTNLIDVMLHDQDLDLLYWAVSKNDEETRVALRQHGLRPLLPLATALEFYGSQLSVHAGRVLVPGGRDAEKAWQELVGASPGSPNEFITHLYSRDRGWLGAYFDALSRVGRVQQAHLTQGSRLKQLYDVYRRAAGNNSSATKGVFPRNADLLILFSRLQWQQDGSPYIPGNLSLWKEILSQNSTPKLIRDWVRNARTWDSPEQLLITMVACSNFPNEAGPLQLYLTLSAIDSARAPGDRLSEGTVRLLASKYPELVHDFFGFPGAQRFLDDAIRQCGGGGNRRFQSGAALECSGSFPGECGFVGDPCPAAGNSDGQDEPIVAGYGSSLRRDSIVGTTVRCDAQLAALDVHGRVGGSESQSG